MKSIRRGFSGFVCVVLSLLLFACTYLAVPAEVLAEELENQRLAREYNSVNSFSMDAKPEYSGLVGEAEEKREESERTFRREDGLWETTVYDEPVAYKADDGYRLIDNTLEKTEVGYTNRESDLRVTFGESLEQGTELEAGESLLLWLWEGYSPDGQETSHLFTGEIEVINHSAEEGLEEEEADRQLRFPPEQTSEAVYRDGETDAEIRYVLSGKRLTEKLTLQSFPGEGFCYYQRLTLKNLDVKDNGDGTYTLVNEEGIPVFELSAPYMTDAAGNDGEAIGTLSPLGDNTWLYTVKPDGAWMKEAVYPVVIDPDVRTSFRDNVEDTYVKETAPGSNYSGRDRVMVARTTLEGLVKINTLPQTEPGSVVLEATLNLSRYNESADSNACIAVYGVTEAYDTETVTWNTKPSRDESELLSYGVSWKQGQFTAFDITDSVRQWYSSGSTGYGMALVSLAGQTYFRSAEYNATYSGHPYLSVIHTGGLGVEDGWSYSSQQAGRVGTGSINLFTGNLCWIREDATVTNGVLGLDVSHAYNDGFANTDIGYGKGWRLNYAQSLELVSVTNRTATENYYKLTDGDGTAHWYILQSGNTYVSEWDKDTTLNVDSAAHTATVTDKGNNTAVFTLNSTDTLGRLTEIGDSCGNRTVILYTDNTVDTEGNVTTGDISNLRVSAVIEQLQGQAAYYDPTDTRPRGQQITFTYNGDNRLETVNPPDGLVIHYTYTSGYIASVTYTDGNSCYYTYDANGFLTEAENIDGYRLTYERESTPPHRISEVTEFAGTSEGNNLSFAYGRNKTSLTDTLNRVSTLYFDIHGQAVSVKDHEGNAVYAAYGTGDREITQLSAVSGTQKTVVNLLKNHGFEESTGWTLGTGAVTDSTLRQEGKQCLKLTATATQAATATQTVALEEGTYTLSGWLKGTSGITLSVYSGSTEIARTETVAADETEWVRESVTFSVASGTYTVKAELSNTGTSYVDSIQLEAGYAPNRYNLLVNGSMTDGISGYTCDGSYISLKDAANARFAEARASHPGQLGEETLEITGKYSSARQALSKEIPIANGQTGDAYTFGGWMSCNSFAETEQNVYSGSTYGHLRTYGIRKLKLVFLNSSGDTVNEAEATFNADTREWQYISGSAVAEGAYSKIRLEIEYIRCSGYAYVDGLAVYRETFSQGYTYDSSGNLTSYTSLLDQTATLSYDSNNNITASTDALGNSTAYTYHTAQSTGNPTDSTHLVKDITTPEGIQTSYTYNDKGQALVATVGTDSLYISSSTAYDSAGLTDTVTDARGNSVTYSYSSSSRQVLSVTDALNNATVYTYQSATEMLRLAETLSPGTGKLSYGYDTNGRLTTVTRTQDGQGSSVPGTVYGMSYDSWGREITVSVGTQTQSTNTYDSYGRLTSVTYGNGYRIEYAYDSLDRVISVSRGTGEDLSLSFAYTYGGDGNLYELRNYETHRSTFFRYDHGNRCMETVEKTFTGTPESGISYTGMVAGYTYQYDACDRLSKLTCKTGSQSWDTLYTYDADGKASTVTLNNGNIISNTYDGLGRLQYKDIGLTNTYRTELTYLTGANGSSTALLATYRNGNDTAYTYTYDANGNITGITQGSTSATYTYNSANELIRENNGFTNKTVVYSYDLWGNLTQKATYAYTTEATPQNPTEVVTYSYGNTDWHDELTSLTTVTDAGTQTETITYDANGNPLTYRGATLTWSGKQLTSYTKGANTVTYTYGEDGLRLSKTVNGVQTSYYYNGTVLMSLTKGTDTLLFSYDQAGNAVSVNYNGTEYYYLRNGQGDIVKIIDGNGSAVVEYTYDSWGRLLNCVGTLSTALGVLNPFRYRGYIYDEETQLYYLQTRYYDPGLCRFISADVLLSTGQGVIGCNAFAYCGNNPINRVDNAGDFWHIVAGAVAGAIIGAASSLWSSHQNGENLLSGKALAKAAVSAGLGAIGGVLTACGLPIGVEIAAGAVVGAVGSIVEQTIDNPNDKLDIKNIAVATVCGAIGGALSGKGATCGNKYISGHVARAWNHIFSDGVSSSIRYYAKMTSTLSQTYIKGTVRGVLLGTIGSQSAMAYYDHRDDIIHYFCGD